MKALIVAVMLCLAVPVFAGDGPGGEATLSGSWAKPDDGHSAWDATGEVLFSLNKHFQLGPSVAYSHVSDINGGAVGATAEVDLFGPFFAGANFAFFVHDAADVADGTIQARAGVKPSLGQHAFLKAYLARTWVRGLEGDLEDPTGTEGFAGLGVRWGK